MDGPPRLSRDTWRRLPTASRAILIVVGLLAIVQTGRGALFALHPDRPQHAVVPFDAFHAHHSCFTAYYEAARLVREAPNIYDVALYHGRKPGQDDRVPPWQAPMDDRRTLSEFYVDAYEYPPPFLLLSRPLVAMGIGFVPARAMWFAFQTAAVVAALLLLAWHLGGDWGARFGLLAPFMYLSLPVQTSIQIGNFQVGAIALAVIAMVAIARGRQLAGAAVLSFVVLAKLFPGVLLLVLARRRAWRPLLLTLAAMVVWIGVARLVLGPAPFEAFWSHHLPRINSGEAFPQLRIPYAVAINQSVFAFPLKLALFGVGDGSIKLASALAWLYTVVVCAVALLPVTAGRAPLLWALVLGLASFRSPFLPQEYAAIGPALTLCLLASTTPWSRRRLAAFAAVFLLLQLQAPWSVTSNPIIGTLVNAVPQLLAVAVFVAAIRFLRREPRATVAG